ncbi:hypothetical protein LEP1GSC127_4557 [Leptospira kirschneri str. 200801925]|uniref:Ankyrin repeat protein n=1 Tax=Leptospira kirschneri str. 200802841 TaxID=1193047 RepID=A0A828Y4W0_9LEPT|nr:ankyrin repeat domain-containing protein [Leptospira kirschneri]EMO75680.1 hypothetical protein LEP1GSC127_4557 [Leptospira kirschneri str. 200801925]EKO52113.1 hypothetical protein LEP1GSC131_4182 [Leptospira kirschneri str. 200802841]EMK17390.1 hypothetical protein LEP1GSC042_3434 [Leptospira kirschneri serovar Bim str. PUO 1247]EMN06083.1 hypothetical protein LEP1GSC046_2675 [Leptospira kirschneri serovar Bim str. 1051]EMO78970.1 hypothetical protein LEP1GSC126_3011 [Leptospira kirschner
MKLLSLILKEFEKSFCKNKIKYIHLVFGTSLFFTACVFPLMIAAKEGEYLISEYLIRHVNARTRDGHTALMMASFNRYPGNRKTSGADIHTMTLQGHTAWSESTLEYYKMIQDILIKAGVGAK